MFQLDDVSFSKDSQFIAQALWRELSLGLSQDIVLKKMIQDFGACVDIIFNYFD